MSRYLLALIRFAVIALLLVVAGCDDQGARQTKNTEGTTTVRFAMLPYGDHTYAIIGVRNNWFAEVGIKLEYQVIKIEQVIPYLKNKTVDVASVPPGILFASYNNAPDVINFVFGDLFQGYAIMAQPDAGYRTYRQLVASGMPPQDALRAALAQLRGKTFAYPPEAAIKPFIELSLNAGGLSTDDVIPLVVEDPLTVNAMRNHQADFQAGGVPSRLTLQREGYIPIVSSVDIAQQAKPSPNSPELASILQNGWATTRAFFNSNRPTILRMASVNYRIMRFMNTNRADAIAIHMPFLTQVTGENFDERDGEIMYNDLNPFVSFEDQYTWFHEETSPFFFLNINGAILNNFKKQGIYRGNAPSVQDVIYADDVYSELERLRDESERLFKIIKQSASPLPQEAKGTFDDARHNFDIYNFYDSERLAREAVKALGSKTNAS